MALFSRNNQGIAPKIRKRFDELFTVGSLPYIKGQWYFVDPEDGTATAGGETWENPVNNLSIAYGKCTSGNGDGIVLLSSGTTSATTTSYLTQDIAWSKHGITVVGVAAPTRMGGRARVANKNITTGAITTLAFPTATTITDSDSGFLTAGFVVGQTIEIVTTDGTNDGQAIITAVTAGTITCSASTFTIQTAVVAGSSTVDTYLTHLIDVSGNNNSFYNIHFFNGDSDDLSIGAIIVSGERNYFGNCHILGAGHATPAATTGAFDLFMNGGAETTFDSCTFGSTTIIRAAANGNIKYDGTARRNVFTNCTILSYSETAGHGAINVVDVGALDGVEQFIGCRFINWKPNGAGTLTLAVIGSTPTSGHFLFDSCSVFGYTAIGASGVVYVGNSDATASGAGGISTTT